MATSTLRRLFGVSSEFSSAENTAINLAASASAKCSQDLSEPESCQAYLAAIEAAAIQLQIAPASRGYRANLPLNYKSLFPSDARNYRVDVLEASLEHYSLIYVNGEKFEFSVDAQEKAEKLQMAWTDLGSLLGRWSSSPKEMRPKRNEVVPVLQTVDSAWASFEEQYISELVNIEDKARNQIVQAVELERRLQHLENQRSYGSPEYREVLRCLVAAISRLNSVANVNRKGRDDLRSEVLLEAQRILRESSSDGHPQGALAAARVLATDVMESFTAMREYLRGVTYCLERVDPHLGNNVGLVARLEDWEECWELGAIYLLHEPGLGALCDAVAEMHRLKESIQELATMLDECDAELFMVLPRLVWLRFLSEPIKQTPLLARLLPHRFLPSKSGTQCVLSEELDAFVQKYSQVESSFVATTSRPCASDLKSIRDLLAERVVRGEADDSHPAYASMPDGRAIEAKAGIEGFVLELEAWSMELQRHCPDDWNQYSAILVQCLTMTAEKKRAGPFGI